MMIHGTVINSQEQINMFGKMLNELSVRKNMSTTSTSTEVFVTNIPTVSVVIPTLNEGKNLPHVLPKIPTWVHEVILVDGNSTDDTVAIAQSILPDIRIIMEKRRGKGIALRTGFASATGDIIIMLDADGSMDPLEIPAFVATLLVGADFAKGSRFLHSGGTHDMSLLRYLGNLGFTWLVRLVYGGQYSDLCYGYNAFWRKTLSALQLDVEGFEIETLMNLRALVAQLKVVEVPSFEDMRIHGQSNLNTFRDGWRVLKTIIRELPTRNGRIGSRQSKGLRGYNAKFD